jgi:phosphohistidine phosphatase
LIHGVGLALSRCQVGRRVRIVVVRHGDAVGEDQAGSDRDRWLSARGREACRGLARLLREQGVNPEVVVASPYPRATQTAELLADGLAYLGPIETWRALEPGASPRVAAQRLGELVVGTVVVVSHEPTVSNLAAFLVDRPGFSTFRTAQACVFDEGRPVFTARADVMAVSTLFVDG